MPLNTFIVIATSSVVISFPGSILIVRGSGHAPGVGDFHHQRRVRLRPAMGIANHQRTVHRGERRGLRMGSVVHHEIYTSLMTGHDGCAPDKEKLRSVEK